MVGRTARAKGQGMVLCGCSKICGISTQSPGGRAEAGRAPLSLSLFLPLAGNGAALCSPSQGSCWLRGWLHSHNIKHFHYLK